MEAAIILLHQWYLGAMSVEAERDRYKTALMEIYKATSGAPMDSLGGKLERLDRVHAVARDALGDEDKLACFEPRRLRLAQMLVEHYPAAEHGTWLDEACARTTREIYEMLRRRGS